ncbi:gamma-butyrobetaine dioxygenase [Drosophila sulfurigaster albostrigata]|uniref:gamma-butyrobetaine dioxygenase n=1 Tax=Drosophila sulfurigaster albostrigata TaxID=89887 RepID=UPI002D21DB41|nr:gamma-butyrobetaine dioxygenase [Drosophila sulfurigaster albostrigata]
MQVSRDLQQELVLLRASFEQPAMQFPEIWLRDNCQCPKCYMQQTRSRLPHGWNCLDTAVHVQQLSWCVAQQTLNIEWNDGHQSSYTYSWLKERDFSPANRARYLRDFYRPEPRHWSGKQFALIQREFQYQDLLSSDKVLLEWLHHLAVYGVALIKQAPLEADVLRKLCNRVGFMRRTTYGDEWSVRAQPGASNYAYLAAPLPLHTDMPYFEYKPGVTLLHTLEQSDSPGGWNLLSDAFHVADLLRQRHPRAFQVLCETPVDWADIGSDKELSFHNIWREPVINLDANGRYKRINHSIPQRDSHFSVAAGQVRPWYEAMALFIQLANAEACTFKTTPGDVLTFDNLRMVHGRTGYDDTDRNVRHIVGAFVDWDIAFSRWRVLRHAQGYCK